MRKTRESNFKFEDGTGKYFASISSGALSTFCKNYNRCNEAGTIYLRNYGIANASDTRAPISFTGLDVIDTVSGGRGFKPCYHVKRFCQNGTTSGIIPGVGNSSRGNQHLYHRPPIVVSGTGLPLVEFPNLQDAQIRAYAAMQPKFEGSVSMLNFLLELPEVLDIPEFVILGVKKIKSIASKIKNHRLKIKDFDPSLPAAESALLYNLGIKPLVMDIQDILLNLRVAASRAQEAFRDKGLGTLERHYSEVYDQSTFSGEYAGLRIGKVRRAVFTATMDYSYDYAMRSGTRALMNYWGLNLTPEVLWNALPVSFLIDYFWSIGQAISWAEVDPNVVLRVAIYGESVKQTNANGYFLDFASLPTLAWPIDVSGIMHTKGLHSVSSNGESLYTRYATSPKYGLVIPRRKGMTRSHALNIAALARCFLNT